MKVLKELKDGKVIPVILIIETCEEFKKMQLLLGHDDSLRNAYVEMQKIWERYSRSTKELMKNIASRNK